MEEQITMKQLLEVMEKGFHGVNVRLDAMNERIGAIEEKLGGVAETCETVATNAHTNDTKIQDELKFILHKVVQMEKEVFTIGNKQ